MIAQMLLAMAFVLVTWVVVAQLLAGIGLGLARLFGTRRVTTDRCLMCFWLGYAAVIGFLQLWHFAWPITWPVLAIIAATGAAGVLWNRRALAAWLFPLLGRRQTFTGALVLGGLWLANQAIGPGDAHDSGLYHYSVIDWSNAYPVVAGMGNLSPALSLNNSSLLFAAALNTGPWADRVEHVVNGQMLFVMLAQVMVSIGRLARERGTPRPTDVFHALLVAPVVMLLFSKEMCSPKTDLPQAMLIFAASGALVGLLADRREDGGDRAFRVTVIAALCAAAICLKLSAAVSGRTVVCPPRTPDRYRSLPLTTT